MLGGQLLGLGRVVEGRERVGVVDAPGGEGGVADVELVPAGGGGLEVGVGVGGAVLGEPQPRAALQEQRCGEGSARRFVELVGGGERGLGGGELVGFGEGVDERVQCPQQGSRRAVGELEVETEASVGQRVADVAGPHQRHSAQEACVRERDEPAPWARELDERRAAGGGGLEVVVGDQHDGGDAAQQRIELAVERAAVEDGFEERAAVGDGSPVEHGLPGGIGAPELESAGLKARGLQPCPALVGGVRMKRGVADELGFEALAILGRRSGGVLESSTAEVEGMVEMAGETKCAGPAQGDLGALGGRRGELDGFSEDGGHIGLVAGGLREPELEPDAGGGMLVERRLGDGAAEEASGAFRCPAGGCAGGGCAEGGDSTGIGVGIGTQQMQRDSLGVGALVREHARCVGVPERALAGVQVRVEGAGDQRMCERDLAVALHESCGAEPVGYMGGVSRIQARQSGGVAQRRGGSEDRERVRETARADWEALELAFDSPGDLVGPERAQAFGRARVRRDVLRYQVVEQRAEQERVAGGDCVAGVREG